MKAMRGPGLALLTITLAATGLVLWGCGGQKAEESAEAPAAGGTEATGVAAPGAGGEVSLAVGEGVYKQRCELCHGPTGAGEGPGGAALNPKPRNFGDAAYMATLTDEVMADRILNGKPGTGMPPHKGIITDAEVKSVILKVRSFSRP